VLDRGLKDTCMQGEARAKVEAMLATLDAAAAAKEPKDAQKPATDKPATDKPATDKPATDKPAAPKPAAPKAGAPAKK
jgi:hypothetical protein